MTDRYRALVVGNSRYPNDEDNLPALEGPINDITLLRAALQDPLVGLFAEDDVTVRAERASHELIGTLDDFFSTAERTDVLLFYYSGHGRLDHTNTLYLCTADTRTDRLRATAVSSNRINEMIEASVASRTIIILDCCHSGAFKGADLASPLAGTGRYVLASCRAKQLASDASHTNQPSLFTASMVAGLRGAAHNRARPGELVLEELHGYVRDQLARMGQQRPQLVSRGDGGLAIAKRPAGFSPPPPPPPPPRQQRVEAPGSATVPSNAVRPPSGHQPPTFAMHPSAPSAPRVHAQPIPTRTFPPASLPQSRPAWGRSPRVWLVAGVTLALALLIGAIVRFSLDGRSEDPTTGPTSPVVPASQSTSPATTPTTTPLPAQIHNTGTVIMHLNEKIDLDEGILTATSNAPADLLIHTVVIGESVFGIVPRGGAKIAVMTGGLSDLNQCSSTRVTTDEVFIRIEDSKIALCVQTGEYRWSAAAMTVSVGKEISMTTFEIQFTTWEKST